MRIIAFITMMVLAGSTAFAQTNVNDMLAFRLQIHERETTLLSNYGKALDSAMANLKNKGDLDTYMVFETEKKRFEEEKTVPPLADVKDTFKVPAGEYHKARLALLKKHISELDSYIKTEMKADRMENAKEAKVEKDTVSKELALLESKAPKSESVVASPKVEMVDGYPSIDGIWKEAEGRYIWVSQNRDQWSAISGFVRNNRLLKWEVKGTITKEGKIEGKLNCTIAQPDYASQQSRIGKLSEDGSIIAGNASYQGGNFDFYWTKVADKTRESAPKGNPLPPIVGVWQWHHGTFTAFYADGSTGTPESKSPDTRWRIKSGATQSGRIFENLFGDGKVESTIVVSSDGTSLTQETHKGEKFTAEKCDNTRTKKMTSQSLKGRPSNLKRLGK